ncbi:MAG: O-methyltransferase [Acidobacteriia bacterium]|nr:O-methyltransferase [Terriglobia bacterium]
MTRLASYGIGPRGGLLMLGLVSPLLFVSWPAGNAPQATQAADTQALRRLEWMRENQRGLWNVDPNEGAFLRDEVIKVKAKRALEIGTSNGYSTIWTALGARRTGGHVTTIEIDDTRAELAGENFRAAGVDSVVTLVHGDALQVVPTLRGPFEFVFIDAWKSDYLKYLEMLLPMVPPGGAIVAHNTTDMRSQMFDFINRIKADPQLKTTFVDAGPGGFSLSIKQPAK